MKIGKLVGIVAISVFGAAGLSAPAQAAPSDDYCVAVISEDAKAPAKKTCARNANAPEILAATAAATPLMTWYDNWHWDTSAGAVTWYGYDGGCDASGYVVHFDDNNFPGWKNRISSFQVHNGCWTTFAYTHAYAPFEGSARYDGSSWFVNDASSFIDLNDDFEGFWVTEPR